MKVFYIAVLWIAGMSLVSFLVFGADKRRAARHEWRIPEKILFLTALLGGAAGAFLGMHIFHHKTRHKSFCFGIPLILLLQAAVMVWLFLSI